MVKEIYTSKSKPSNNRLENYIKTQLCKRLNLPTESIQLANNRGKTIKQKVLSRVPPVQGGGHMIPTTPGKLKRNRQDPNKLLRCRFASRK